MPAELRLPLPDAPPIAHCNCARGSPVRPISLPPSAPREMRRAHSDARPRKQWLETEPLLSQLFYAATPTSTRAPPSGSGTCGFFQPARPKPVFQAGHRADRGIRSCLLPRRASIPTHARVGRLVPFAQSPPTRPVAPHTPHPHRREVGIIFHTLQSLMVKTMISVAPAAMSASTILATWAWGGGWEGWGARDGWRGR